MSEQDQHLDQPSCRYCGVLLGQDDGRVCYECWRDDPGPDPDDARDRWIDQQLDAAEEARRLQGKPT